jgi:hypothetical protein
MDLDTTKTWVEIVSGLVTILGLPFAIATYIRRKNQESLEARTRADDEAYSRLFTDYNDYLKLVMQYPELDLGDEPLPSPPSFDDDPLLKIRAVSLFNVFLSLVERAYLLYGVASDEARNKQWRGWQAYTVEVLSRPHIRAMYERHKDQYDASFVAAVDQWFNDPRI